MDYDIIHNVKRGYKTRAETLSGDKDCQEKVEKNLKKFLTNPLGRDIIKA